jgi:hypothetical protein
MKLLWPITDLIPNFPDSRKWTVELPHFKDARVEVPRAFQIVNDDEDMMHVGFGDERHSDDLLDASAVATQDARDRLDGLEKGGDVLVSPQTFNIPSNLAAR